SGSGVAINYHPARRTPEGQLRVGLIGLGIGTIAAYGRPGDTFRFYEINPQTEQIARKYFSYLHQGNARNEVVIGDGRISLARELISNGPQQFDVLVVDAFSGDAIPIHLLTREAVDLYWQHLKEDGILAVHVTNIHVDLFDVVRQLAEHSGRTAIHIEDYGDNYYESTNDWVLITNNGEFLQDRRVRSSITPWRTKAKPIFWTDDFSNLFEIVDW
ncbi:MAG: fused MFS/spermidine synthase, partial [Gammaproteobacteria bacterium]|nr:fused MFS/spermidine synthase [Gammaproteobacteria bacterium]